MGNESDVRSRDRAWGLIWRLTASTKPESLKKLLSKRDVPRGNPYRPDVSVPATTGKKSFQSLKKEKRQSDVQKEDFFPLGKNFRRSVAVGPWAHEGTHHKKRTMPPKLDQLSAAREKGTALSEGE